MSWSYNGKVPPIQRCHLQDTEPLTGRYDGSVDGAQRKISILPNQLCDTQPVRRRNRVGRKGSGREVTEEPDFGLGPEAGLEQVGNLCDDQSRDYQRPLVGRQQIQACLVVAIILIHEGIERPRINQ